MPPAAPPQTSAANSAQPTFTDAEWTKLNLYWEKVAGEVVKMSPSASQILGLTKPGETITYRQIEDSDQNGKDKVHIHYYSRFDSYPNLLLFYYFDKSRGIDHGYLTDKNLHLISSYVWAATEDAPVAMGLQEGQSGLAAEIRWWAKDMDESPNP